MARRRRAKTNIRPWKNVPIHPDLHEMLTLSAYGDGQSLLERAHEVLCEALKKPNLIEEAFERSSK